MNATLPDTKPTHGRQVTLLLLLVAVMFCVGFLMAPLYRVLCSLTGINGNTPGRIADTTTATTQPVDFTRTITVQFDTTINTGLFWEFTPLQPFIQVHPGQLNKAEFYVKNNTNQPVIGQAIPGITPWQATRFFNKTECFCFTQQTLQAGEAKTLPVYFIVSPELPTDLTTITLSYTFMNTERKLAELPPQPLAP